MEEGIDFDHKAAEKLMKDLAECVELAKSSARTIEMHANNLSVVWKDPMAPELIRYLGLRVEAYDLVADYAEDMLNRLREIDSRIRAAQAAKACV